MSTPPLAPGDKGFPFDDEIPFGPDPFPRPKFRSSPDSPVPHDREAERAVLSALLSHPHDCIPMAMERARPESFYVPAHRILFETILDLYDRALPVDIISLASALRDRSRLEEAGGAAELAGLLSLATDTIPTPDHLRHWLGQLEDQQLRRDLLRVCREISERALEQGENTADLLDQAESQVLRIRETIPLPTNIDLKGQVMEVIRSIEEAYHNPGEVRGIASGLPDLDRLTGGFSGGQFWLVGGTVGVGKTALLTQIVANIAFREADAPVVGWMSLQEPAQQITLRLLANTSGADLRKLNAGQLDSRRDFPRLCAAAGKLAERKNLLLDDTPALSIMELRSKARRWKQKYNVQILVIDALPLIRSISRRASESWEMELAEISAGLKAIARELDVTVLATATSGVPPATDPTPRSDLKCLQPVWPALQDADVVALLDETRAHADRARHRMELRLVKQRSGPTGRVVLDFEPCRMRFAPATEPETASPPTSSPSRESSIEEESEPDQYGWLFGGSESAPDSSSEEQF